MIEILNYINQYSPDQQAAISFHWNGQNKDGFKDLNLDFRRIISKAVISAHKNAPLILVRDLYNAELDYMRKSGCGSTQISHLGKILLEQGTSTYLWDFLVGRFGTEPMGVSHFQVKLSKELAGALKKECESFTKSITNIQEHDIWNKGVDFFKDLEDYTYPEWFYRNLVENSFPWELGKEMSFADFNRKNYTLHDSGWGTINISLDAESLILMILWDTVWLPETIETQIETSLSQVFLLIKIGGIEEIRILNGDSPPSFVNILISDVLVEVNGKKLLSLSDAAGGTIDITYKGKETFLAMTECGRILGF
jgi:hypothetical protein